MDDKKYYETIVELDSNIFDLEAMVDEFIILEAGAIHLYEDTILSNSIYSVSQNLRATTERLKAICDKLFEHNREQKKSEQRRGTNAPVSVQQNNATSESAEL